MAARHSSALPGVSMGSLGQDERDMHSVESDVARDIQMQQRRPMLALAALRTLTMCGGVKVQLCTHITEVKKCLNKDHTQSNN